MTPEERAKLEDAGGWLAVALGEKFGTDVVFAGIWQEIQRRIRVAVAEEREACAREAENTDHYGLCGDVCGPKIATAIRARNDA